MLREANCFLAGAAWSDFGCYACCPLATGRHRGAALVAREVVSLWLRLMGAGFLCPWRGRARLFFPTRGKEPKGDRWQPNRDSTMAAPGPLAAWLGSGTSYWARL